MLMAPKARGACLSTGLCLPERWYNAPLQALYIHSLSES
jgi:hypothetical protein